MQRDQRLEAREPQQRKALLLRVGIDRGAGGILAPVFPDGSFEYIPPPETVPTRSALTYATVPGRHVASLAAVLPRRLAGRRPHVDPDFDALVYGDALPRKRSQLRKLSPGDLLVFYAGLQPCPAEDKPRIFAIGWIEVACIHQLKRRDIARSDLRRRFGATAHFLRSPPDPELVLVEGGRRGSRLLSHAVPLGDSRNCLLRDLAAFDYQGSLLRAVGHWIRGESAVRALEDWLRAGPASLVEEPNRLIPVAASAVDHDERNGDLVIHDAVLCVGDWVFGPPEFGISGIQLLARINRVEQAHKRFYASLFWRFSGRPAPEHAATPSPANRGRMSHDQLVIWDLVSWFHAHYRISISWPAT